MAEAIGAAVGAIIDGLIAYLVARWQSRKQQKFTYDLELQRFRLKPYEALWEKFEPIAMQRTEPLDAVEAKKLAEDLTAWYYRTGGMSLSVTSQPIFVALRDFLNEKIKDETISKPETLKEIQKAGTQLRSALPADLGTRSEITPQRSEEAPGPGFMIGRPMESRPLACHAVSGSVPPQVRYRRPAQRPTSSDRDCPLDTAGGRYSWARGGHGR